MDDVWEILPVREPAWPVLLLLLRLPMISHRADVASDPATTADALRDHGNRLMHSIGEFVVRLIATLSIVKPRG